MLQRIRERISGWIAIVVIILVAGAFVLFGIEYYFQQGFSNEHVAATVNKQKITHAAVDQLYSQMLKRANVQNKSLPVQMKDQLRSMALQSLITQVAMITTLENKGFNIGEPQIKYLIQSSPEFKVNNRFSEEKLQSVLMQNGMTLSDLFDRVKSQFILNQIMSGLSFSIFALPNEMKHWFQLINQQRAFRVAMVSAKQLTQPIDVSTQEIDQYYQAHQSEFKTPAMVKAKYLLLSPSDIAKNITITPEAAKAFYENNLQNYQLPARWELLAVTVPFQANPSDNKHALQVRNAWVAGTTPAQAGKMTVSEAGLNYQLKTILQSLKPNEISEPIRTSNGFVIFKIEKYLPAKTTAFTDAEKSIVELMKHQEANKILNEKSSQLADLTYTNPNTLEPAAKALNLTVQESPLVSAKGEASGVFANPQVLSALFSDSVLNKKNNSDPITLSDGSLAVFHVVDHTPEKQQSLAEVSAQIKSHLLQEKTKTQLGLLTYDMQKQLQQGSSPETLANTYHLTWQQFPLTSQNAPALQKISPEIVNTVFNTSLDIKDHKVIPKTTTLLLPNGDYALIQITDFSKDTTPNATLEKQVAQEYFAVWQQTMQHAFVESVVSQSKIVMNSNNPGNA